MTPEQALRALGWIVEPPAVPSRPAEIDWAAFAARNGFEAPADYRLLVETYGVAGFGTESLDGGWLRMLDPLEPGATLVDLSDWDRRNMRGHQHRFPDQYPGWRVWPEPGGFLPWADSADGDLIGWQTVGEPDAWGTRFFGRGGEFETFAYGAAEFVYRILSGNTGAASLDGRFAGLEPGERLRCFPVPPGTMRTWARPIENITVTFVGLSPAVDPAALPTPDPRLWGPDFEAAKRLMDEHTRRQAEALRPADDIIAAWRVDAQPRGVKVSAIGIHSSGRGDPLHHEIAVTFDPANEPAAKAAVEDLARRLGVGIREVRNLEDEPIWTDLSNPG
jgi:hypothetical protein